MSETLQEKQVYDAAAEEAHLLERCQKLVERAVDAGADEAEAFGVKSDSCAVRFEKGDLKVCQVDESAAIGLRVFKDKKLGFSSTNQVDDASLGTVASDALTLAAMSLPDEANVLPRCKPVPGLGLVTPELLGFPIEAAVEHGRALMADVVGRDPRIALDSSELGFGKTSVAVHSSAGAHSAESDASIGLSLFGMAVDGDEVGGFDYWGDSVRSLDGLEPAMRDSADHFTEAILGNLGAGAAESYRGKVLFSPYAFVDIFISPLVSGASAIAVQRGRSALIGKVGESIAHASLEIIDDPTDRRLAGAAAFDREGVRAKRFPLVLGGVLQSYLYNSYAANVDGTQSTGHARGGTRSVPGLGTHSLSVSGSGPGGPDGRTALVRNLDRGLVVQRFSGSVDAASGDFSGVAKSARWVENGEIVRSLKETLISGNVFELLKGAFELSSKNEVLMGSTRAPWALIDGVSVTAG